MSKRILFLVLALALPMQGYCTNTLPETLTDLAKKAVVAGCAFGAGCLIGLYHDGCFDKPPQTIDIKNFNVVTFTPHVDDGLNSKSMNINQICNDIQNPELFKEQLI